MCAQMDHEPCCQCTPATYDPLKVTIAETQDNYSILEEFEGTWTIASHGERTMTLQFRDKTSKSLVYGSLIARSKRLLAY